MSFLSHLTSYFMLCAMLALGIGLTGCGGGGGGKSSSPSNGTISSVVSLPDKSSLSSLTSSSSSAHTSSAVSSRAAGTNSTSSTSASTKGLVVSGYVLDGQVTNARVCFDINGDNQCNSSESFTITDSSGYFSLHYKEQELLQNTQLIADVRFDEALDSDYSKGRPDYDYVLKSFDQSQSQVIISPISTYMDYKFKTSDLSKEEVLSDTVQILKTSDSYTYSTSSVNDNTYFRAIQGNFVDNSDSSNEATANFSKRLHNVNQVLARKMQESESAWEHTIYSTQVELADKSWSELSKVTIENANANVFQGFENIAAQIGVHNFNDFDAATVNARMDLYIPSPSKINNLMAYNNAYAEAENELSGEVYVSHTYIDEEIFTSSYYVYSDYTYTYYIDSEDKSVLDFCVKSPPTHDINRDLFNAIIMSFNDSLPTINNGGTLVTPLTKTLSVPKNCSSIADFLSGFSVKNSFDLAEDGDILTIPNRSDCDLRFGNPDGSYSCAPPAPMVLPKTPIVERGTLVSGTNQRAGTLKDIDLRRGTIPWK